MLAAIRGEPCDALPWAPRLDLWYNANKRANTLPAKYKDASLIEIADDMDVGFHAVVPQFRDLRNPEDDIDRALGVYNLHTMPYRTVFENMRRNVTIDGDRTIVEYETKAGKISTAVLYDESMRKAGISITHITEHAIKNVNDYKVVGDLFANARVEPNYEGYKAFAEHVGSRGLAIGFISLAASPMHLIQRELAKLETFFYHSADHTDELAELAEQIGLYWQRVLDVVANSPAEVIFLGANYDASVTYPPFFAEHITGWLKKFAATLHSKGKYLLTHTDGENTGLLGEYVDSQIDIADSICPKPMTKLSFKDVRDFFDGKITIMGGIPSISLSEESMSEGEFDKFSGNFFEEIEKGDHLILGISDTTPPGAKFERIEKITQLVKNFGPIS